MSKVLGIVYINKEYDKGNCLGYTECCGASVRRGRCGCDEYCPNCGALLDWSGDEDE